MKIRYKKINLSLLLWGGLIAMMILITRTNAAIKIGLLLMICLVCFFSDKILWRFSTIIFFVSFYIYAILGFTIGWLNGNPGVMGYMKMNILYPLIFIVAITIIRRESEFVKLTRILVVISFVLCIYTLAFFLYQIGLWPFGVFITLGQTGAAALHEGYTHITNTNLSMVIFLAPMNLILLFEEENKKSIFFKLLLINFILLSVCIVLSGRRILFGVLVIPIFYEIFCSHSIKRNKKIKICIALLIGGVIVGIFLSFLNLISISGLIERCISVFRGAEGSIRSEQIVSLWKGFLKNPILGSGAGVGTDYIRGTKEMSWIYEASYNLILYNSGIIGTFFYAFALILLGFRLYRIRKRNKYIRAILVSYISALLANATNPYFSSSFDFLWFIFLPLMCLNIYDKRVVTYNDSKYLDKHEKNLLW